MSTIESEADIQRVARGLMDRTLPKSQWTHAAHFAAVLWLLRRDGTPAVMAAMPGLIRAYNESVGGVNSDSAGYHETITHASIRAAADVLEKAGDAPLDTVLQNLMVSALGRPGWLAAYWSRDRLLSVAARRGWVEPDVAPLPF